MRGRNWGHAGDVPDEGGEFARDGDDCDGGKLAVGGEAAEAAAQPELRIPGAIHNGLGQSLMADLDDAADLGRKTIRPGGFDQSLAGVAVAGLGDAAEPAGTAGAVFRGRQTQPGH